MSCPVCGDRCACAGADAASSLFDPDEYDLSEERFAASLDILPEESASATENFGGRPEGDTRSGETEQGSGAIGGLAMEDGAMWRQEVASRIESYRARRRRPIRERSLPLDFERAVNRQVTLGSLSETGEERVPASEFPVAACDESEGRHSDLATRDPDLPRSEAGTQNAELGESNLIEFPRQAMLPVMPPSSEELAEPVIDRPRILDVSEEVDTTAPLADISIAPEEDPTAGIEFELPLQVASMSQRIFAGFADAIVVLVAAAIFVVITLKAGVAAPQAKAGFLLALAVPCLFWAVYEYMFLVYAGSTPGMQVARLDLITFEGLRVRRRTRRARALALVLSTLSLGLGLIWALLDEATLCWHDRITRTYVVIRT